MCVPVSQRFAGKVGEAGEIFRKVGRLIFKGNKFFYERREGKKKSNFEVLLSYP